MADDRDIVLRLRDPEYDVYSWRMDETMREAADEIERLRATVNMLIKEIPSVPGEEAL